MTAPLGIIAGLGDLPVVIADEAVATGRGVYVIRIKGFEEPKLSRFPGEVIGIGEIGKTFKALRAAGCEDVTFAGIVNRPNFKDLKLDMKGAALLPKVMREARRGDDSLLRVMIDAFEKQGFSVKGSDEVQANLVMPEGCLTVAGPTAEHMQDLRVAAHVAATVGALDVGQGCVVCDGLVLAVEAQEGTDEMLKRCAKLPIDLRGSQTARKGLLLKRPKPVQERRIDLPTAGVSTIKLASEAGLAGIAIEAGGGLLINKAKMIEAANADGLFIYGFNSTDEA